MRRLSCHCLIQLLMALVLALATPLVAAGHHGDSDCLETRAAHAQAALWSMGGAGDVEEPDASLASPCCLPCAQCGTTAALPAGNAVVASLPLSGPDLGEPAGPPDPFERPPRL